MEVLLDLVSEVTVSTKQQPALKVGDKIRLTPRAGRKKEIKSEAQLWEIRKEIYERFLSGESKQELAKRYSLTEEQIDQELKYIDEYIVNLRAALIGTGDPEGLKARMIARYEQIYKDMRAKMEILWANKKYKEYVVLSSRLQDLLNAEARMLQDLGAFEEKQETNHMLVDGLPIDKLSTQMLSKKIQEKLKALEAAAKDNPDIQKFLVKFKKALPA